MKTKLYSALQTLLAGLGGAGGYLAGKDLIDAGDIGKVDAAGGSLALALATIVGAILFHLLLKLVAKFVPALKPLLEDKDSRLQCLAGFPWLVVSAGIAAVTCIGCTPAQLADIANAWDAKAVIRGTDERGNGVDIVIRPKRARIVEEKSTPDFTELLEREWSEGRFAPGPLSEWPPIERKPRRLVIP